MQRWVEHGKKGPPRKFPEEMLGKAQADGSEAKRVLWAEEQDVQRPGDSAGEP